MPTFDFINIVRSVLAAILTALTSTVGQFITIVSLCFLAFEGVFEFVQSFHFIDFTISVSSLSSITNNTFFQLCSYCLHFDYVLTAYNTIVSSVASIIPTLAASFGACLVGLVTFSLMSALKADVKDMLGLG